MVIIIKLTPFPSASEVFPLRTESKNKIPTAAQVMIYVSFDMLLEHLCRYSFTACGIPETSRRGVER